MAIILVAVLLALIVMRSVAQPAQWRNFTWFEHWQQQAATTGDAHLGLIICIGLPVLVCSLVQFALHGVLFNLISVAYAAIVLFYCWGPRDLEHDVDAVDKAIDSERRIAAVQALRERDAQSALAYEPEALAQAVFSAGLRRWFSVLLWFVLLGPAGALGYRLLQLIASAGADSSTPESRKALAQCVLTFVEWIPARLIALALALVSNFDAVLKTWRDRHAAMGKGYFDLDPGFLDAIARASVDADVLAESDDGSSAGDGGVHVPINPPNPLVALDDAMVLMRRVLIAWLTVVALIVLAGWFG